MIQLCQTDEENALEFLARAIPVIAACGMRPATLDLLDSMNKHPNAYGLGDRPGMAALAAEWAGPYQSPAVGDPETSPKTIRELVIAALGADAEGNIEFGFRTFASDETEHWNLPDCMTKARAFGLYLIREDERTYCCSLTPSSWAVALENVFVLPDQSAEPRDQYGRTRAEAEIEDTGMSYEAVESCYFGFMGERADLDKREAMHGDVSARVPFDQSVLRVDVSKLASHAGSPGHPDQRDAFADPETLAAAFYKVAAEAAWEDAEESFSGNAHHPRIICELEVAA